MNQLSAMNIHRWMDQDHTIVCDLMGLQRNPRCVLLVDLMDTAGRCVWCSHG
jgi:hypothetical protein